MSINTRRPSKKLILAGLIVTPTVLSEVNYYNALSSRYNAAPLPYRDPSLPVSDRIDDLIQRMTLDEKVGQLFQSILMLPANGSTTLSNETSDAIKNNYQTHFNLNGAINSPRVAAQWHNNVQRAALDTRLGIPITMSSDPRHSYTDAVGTQIAATAFSQ